MSDDDVTSAGSGEEGDENAVTTDDTQDNDSNVAALIVDNGSGDENPGFAPDEAPRASFPTTTRRP